LTREKKSCFFQSVLLSFIVRFNSNKPEIGKRKEERG